MRYIKEERVNFAFKQLSEGKIGRKKTWVLSGLTGKEFLDEWEIRGAKEVISDSIMDKMDGIAAYLDFSPNSHRKGRNNK